MKKYLSDILLFSGLLSLAGGVWIEYSVGLSLIVCGSLIILLGVRLIPKKG